MADAASKEMIEKAAEAILNARAGRRGAPEVVNLRALVSAKVWAEALDEARAAASVFFGPKGNA